MKTSIDENAEVRLRSGKQKNRTQSVSRTRVTTTWPWGHWDTTVRHMMKSFSRFDILCTCCGSLSRSVSSICPDRVGHIFPNRAAKSRGMHTTDKVHKDANGDKMHATCVCKSDPCASIRLFIHRGYYKYTINTSERVRRVLNDARFCLFSPFFSRVSFSFLIDRRSYVHLGTRIISTRELPGTCLER